MIDSGLWIYLLNPESIILNHKSLFLHFQLFKNIENKYSLSSGFWNHV